MKLTELMELNKQDFTVSITQDRIKDLNLDISLASSDVQLVKQIPITDVNDVATLLLPITFKYC